MSERPRPSIAQIAGLFFRIGNQTFGSGAAAVALLSREMDERKWLERWESDATYTLSRVVPGTNVLAFVAAAAHAVRGWPGAIAAMLALSIPASCVVVALTLVYERWHSHPFGNAAIGAAMAAIVGIVSGAAWLMAVSRFRPGARVRTCVFVVAAALLSFYLSPLSVVALGAVAAYLWPERQ